MEAITTVPRFDRSIPSLGAQIIHWCETRLVQPDGDNAGQPFRMTAEQKRFVLWFYALNTVGKFNYRRAVLRRAKGWGKSPFLAALCLAELCGPVRCGGWDASGRPIGEQHPMPWVNLAGVSETQTQNTMTVALAMLENSPALDEYGLDVGMTRIFTPWGGKLSPITASSSTQEGARPSFIVLDETHWWTESNGGWKLARVIRRNLAKVGGRSIETTNAHEPGSESVAEASYLNHLAILEGRTREAGLFYDSREAPSGVSLAEESDLLAGLAAAYGDASWVDLERIRDEVWDPSTPPEEARRFYLNQITAAADAWVSDAEWDANRDATLPPLEDKETVVLGFDGALTDDSTALVAMRVSDAAPFLLGLWERPQGAQGAGWEVDKTAVRDMVDHAFSRYDVVAMFADVAYWEPDIDVWRTDHGERLLIKATTKHAIGYDMRSHLGDTVRATEGVHRAILDGTLPHNGDSRLRRHVLNARRRPNRWGISFGKETRESPNKVDALAALILAHMARARVLSEGVLGKRRGRVGALYGF